MKFNQKLTSKALFTIVGGAVLINPVFAQDQGSEELEEVVVTGMRGSLKQSMEIKRDSIGVVDAITAEDIGKFPDTNLAESLQRIPGVSIDRQNGEGSQVTVRGFGPVYNLVTLNGRTVRDGRGQPVRRAELRIRAPRVAASTSRTLLRKRCRLSRSTRPARRCCPRAASARPSTSRRVVRSTRPGRSGSFGAKALTDTSNEEGSDFTPEVSGLFSWTNEGETLGFGVFGEYAERDSGAAMGQTNGWNRAARPTTSCTHGERAVKQTAPTRTS